MKRSTSLRHLKQAALALPMAALVVTAAHAATSMGINFSASYGGNGSYPSTASSPVTSEAFGIEASDWFSTAVDSKTNSVTMTPSTGGSFNVAWASKGANISYADAAYMPGYVGYPGDPTVYYGNLSGPYAISLSGLANQFPNGYVIQPFAAANQPSDGMLDITVTDGVTTNDLSYHSRGQFMGGGFYSGGGSFGYYSPTTNLFTADAVTIEQTNTDINTYCSWLSGFIITDKPVISLPPDGASLASGETFSLNPYAVGVQPLYYQWRLNGVAIPGANSLTYSKANAVAGDSGNYDLVVTNISGSVTSAVVVVSVSVPATVTWDADVGTAGAQDGSGIWDLTTANWWKGTGDAAWGNYSFAVFGGGNDGTYTVTLANKITASGLTFNNGHYTITNVAGETITLAGPGSSSPSILFSRDTEVDVPLAGASGLNIDGSGTLTLTARNTYTGVTTVSNGTLNLPAAFSGTDTSLKSKVINLMPGTALTCNYYAFGWYANDNVGGLTINVNGASCQPAGAFGVAYSLTGGSIAGGVSSLDLGAHGGFNPSIITYPSATTSIINPAGGFILRSDSGLTNYVFSVAKGTTPNGIDLDIQVPIKGADCSVTKTGEGTMHISGAATATGGMVVSNGTLLVDGIVNASRLVVGSGASLMISMNRAANTYGKLQGLSTAMFGGTLVVTNLGGTFQVGDTFNLLNAVNYSGDFSTLILPPLPASQNWSWSPTTGTLSVTSATGAAALTWDANPNSTGSQLDGSGTWDLTTANWWDGTNDVIWSPAGIAVFGGGVDGDYYVTLQNGVNQNVSGLKFNSGNYYIEDNNGIDGITLVGSPANPPSILFNNDTEIDVPMAGASGLNINGTGKLTLTTQNTYTGVTTVSNGTLSLPTPFSQGDTSLKTSVINLMPGTTLNCDYRAFGWYANNGAGGLTINVNGATCFPTGSFGIAYALTGGNIAGGVNATLDLGASGGFNSSIKTYASATTSVINPSGGKVLLRSDSGQVNYTFDVAAGTTSNGIDLDVQVPIQRKSGNCSVIKTGAGTMRISGVNTYGGATTVSNGTLMVDGSLTTTALTLNPNTITMFVMNRAQNTYGSMQGGAAATASFAGTLMVTNVGGVFQSGDTFNLFNAFNASGDFSSKILPPLPAGLNWSWSPTTGVLSVIAGPNLNPTNVLATVTNGTLNLSWPLDHTGWRLLVQTNNLATGVSSNTNDWMTVANSVTTNAVSIPMDGSKPSEFYRLAYP
jgi:fibronectin-binding autotransporter adhesin